MSVVRATALSNFCDVVRQVGGDPDAILSGAGIDPEDAGRVDVFLRGAGRAVNRAETVPVCYLRMKG